MPLGKAAKEIYRQRQRIKAGAKAIKEKEHEQDKENEQDSGKGGTHSDCSGTCFRCGGTGHPAAKCAIPLARAVPAACLGGPPKKLTVSGVHRLRQGALGHAKLPATPAM